MFIAFETDERLRVNYIVLGAVVGLQCVTILERVVFSWVWYTASPQQCDLRLLGPPKDQGAGGGARTCNGMVRADTRIDSLSTVPPTPP
ncbi:hypothetical protein PoB_004058800 [Plakobranchus ocellatus]|uniref:Uncharacterized protein n=1 Tax=Plakobranchus ocellatus TaxID=259542 RepID=A0AAV4B5N4_9GAST|nr:hypothetical protein PoB_004058800 [Plakobranchus ocellatus]